MAAISPVHRLFVLTPWWRNRLLQAGVDKETAVIPNPMPPEWEEESGRKRVAAAETRSDIRMITVTRLEWGKGVDLVVEAIPFLPMEYRAFIIGSGSREQALMARADELGLKGRVVFTGWLDGDEKRVLIRQADIFCLPSTYDSFGMGFVEAMAHGVPVVALDWGPVGDVVPQEKAGLLIGRSDPTDLADGLLRLEDPHIRRRMGEFGKRWVSEQFGSQVVGKRLAVEFQSLASQGQPDD